MPVNCNIAPQIKVGDTFEDSELFMNLWDRAKQLYPNDAIKARNKAKRDYALIRTPQFIRKYGNWVLLHKLRNNTATNADLATFQSLYGSNIERLTNSITIKLNRQNEPVLTSNKIEETEMNSIAIVPSDYMFATASEYNYVNNVFASLFIRNINALTKGLTKNSSDTIRTRFVSLLRTIAEAPKNPKSNFVSYLEKHNALLQSIYSEKRDPSKAEQEILDFYRNAHRSLIDLANEIESGDRRGIWASFVHYYKAEFGGIIHDDTVEDYEDMLEQATVFNEDEMYAGDEITKNWDSSKQFKEDRKKTVSIVFKKFLLSMIYNQGSIMYDFEQDANSASANGKSLHNISMDNFESKYGLKRPIDINTLWNQLIVLTADITTSEELVNKLSNLSSAVYNGALQPLIDKLRKVNNPDDNADIKRHNEIADRFFNTYCNSVRMAMTSVSKSVVTSYNTDEGQAMSYRTEMANKECFGRHSIYNIYRTALSTVARSNSTVFTDIVNDTTGVKGGIVDLTSKIVEFSNRLTLFIDLSTIASYISTHNKMDYNEVFYMLTDKNYVANNEYTKSKREAVMTDVRRLYDLIRNIANVCRNNSVFTVKPKDVVNDNSLENDAPIEAADDLKNYINLLSIVGSFQPGYKVNLMFINAKGETEYTPEFFNSLSNRIQGIVSDTGEVRSDIARERFKDLLTSVNLKDNPVLWNIDNSNGLFNPKIVNGSIQRDENGVPIVGSVNEVAFSQFRFERFSGLTNADTGVGIDYVGMHGLVWTNDMFIRQMQGLFSMPSGDASRCYQFSMASISSVPESDTNYSLNGIPTKLYDFNRKTFINPIEIANKLGSNITEDQTKIINNLIATLTKSRIFKLFKAGIKQEIDNMKAVLDMLYVVDNDGILSVKPDFIDQATGKLDVNKLRGLSSPIFWNGKELLNDKGLPTGRIFEFLNYTYRAVEDGKEVVKSFLDYLDNKDIRTLFKRIGNVDKTTNAIDIALNEEEYTNALVSFFIDIVNSRVAEGRDQLSAIRKTITSTETYKNQKGYIEKANGLAKDSLDADSAWDITLANQFMLYSVYSIAYQDMFIGSSYEFKNALDWAKRVSQASRIGAVTLSKERYKQIVVNDAFVTSNMLGLLKAGKFENGETLSDEDIEKLVERYGDKNIESTNAFNVITEVEALRRLKEKGDYDRYNPDGILGSEKNLDNTIERLINDKAPVSKEEYIAVVQQLKYYYFDRTNDFGDGSSVSKFASSHQDKNSTIILFSRMYRGTEYEKLANWMKQEGIDSINFVSAHKVGSKPVLEIFKKDADTSKTVLNITKNAEGRYVLGDGTIKISDYIHHLKYSSLYTQQTIPSHLKDETNKIGTQLEKKIFDNLVFDGTYNDPSNKSNKLKGKTASNVWTDSDQEAGLFNRYHMMLAAKTADNEFALLKEWGAIDENGNVKRKPGTNYIEIDVNRMMRDIRDYFNDTSTSQNILEAVRVINGRTFLPLWHPTIKSKIESVLLARVDKKINRLKIKGAHCTIQPDNLIVPSVTPDAALGKKNLTVGDEDIIRQHIANGTIRFSREFWESRCEMNPDGTPKMVNGSYVMKKVKMYDAKGNTITTGNVVNKTDASFELRSEYYDENGVFHPAEMILNSWDSRLPIDKDGYLDLNAIPDDLKTMFGIRIPTEGMQSMFIVKVVGVVNNGASQAILPRHIMERTGHDFDIDSIYLYMKDFEVISKDDKTEYVAYEVEGNNAKRQAIDYLTNLYFKEDLDAINDDYYTKRSKVQSKLDPLYEALYENNKKAAEYINYRKAKANKQKAINRLFNESTEAAREAHRLAVIAFDEAESRIRSISESIYKIKENRKDIYDEIDKVSKEFDAITKERDEAIKQLKNDKVLNKYNSLDVYRRSAMQAKDNYLIDTWISILSDPKSIMNREKPNTYEESVNMSDYINVSGGYNSKHFNQHFMLDALKMRNTINDISVLKGIAISASQTMGVMAQTGMKFRSDLAVPIRITMDEVVLPDNIHASQKLTSIKTKLKRLGFSEEDIIIDGGDIIVNCRTPFNNPAGTWMDINDMYISEQATELPAHILDAAKYFMGYNINTTTAPMLALLTSFPISHKVNLEGEVDVKGVNRFAFANLLIHQQVIVDFVNELAVNQLSNKYTYSNVAFANIREHYTYDLVNVLAYLYNSEAKGERRFKDLIEKFNISKTGSKKYNDNDLKLLTDLDALSIQAIANNPDGLDANSFRKAYASRNSYYTARQVEVALKFITSLNRKGIDYNYYNETYKKAPSIASLNNSFKQGISFNKNVPSIEAYASYLSSQLNILDYYMQLDKTVQSLRLAQATLTAEKKGAGPDMTVSDKFLDSIIKLHLNFDDIITEAKRKGVPDYIVDDAVKNYYSANSVISKSDSLTTSINKFNSIIKDINSRRSPEDQVSEIKITPPAIVVGNNESAMKAVYPFLFDESLDVVDSIYPLMAQQLKSVNVLATRLFSDLFITEDPTFKANINYALHKLGRPNDPVIRDKFINYAINSSSAKLPFFRGIEDPNDVTTVNSERIARIVGAIPIYYEVNGNSIQAKFFGTSTGDDKAYSEYSNMSMQDIVKTKFEFSSSSHEDRVKLYRSLPVATQVSILKATLGPELTNDFDNILNLLSPSTNVKQMLRKGYIGVPLTRYADIESRTIDTLLSMINSPDDFIRATGEDLVIYAFYIYGMRYGKNFSRYIFNGLLGNSIITVNGEQRVSTALRTRWGDDFNSIDFTQIDGTSDADMRNTKYKNGDYEFRSLDVSMAMYADNLYIRENNVLFTDDIDAIDQLIENFVKANADNAKVVHRMAKRRTTSNDANIKNQEIKFTNCNLNELAKLIAYAKDYKGIDGQEAWNIFNNKYEKDADAINALLSNYDRNSDNDLKAAKHLKGYQVLNQIIIVPRSWIESSEFAKETYLVSKTSLLNDPGISIPAVVKRNFKTEGKLYKAIFKDSFVYYVPINRTLPTEYGNTVIPVYEFGIEDFTLYEDLVDKLDKFLSKSDKANIEEVEHNSISLTIQEVTSNADETVYIGSEDGFNSAFIKGDSVTKASIPDVLGLQLDKENPFREIKNLALIGGNETLSVDERLTISSRFTNVLNSFIERHRVQQVNVVQNGDVSDAIIDALRSNKRVDVQVHTIKETVHNSVALSTFDDGSDNGNRINAIETLETINKMEKIAIANVSIVNNQLQIIGKQDTKLVKAATKEKEMQALMPKDFTNIDNLNQVLDYNIATLELIVDRLRDIAIHTEPSYIGALFEDGRDQDRNVYLTDLNIVDTLIASQAYINDLVMFDETEFVNDVKLHKAIKAINDKIQTLKNIYNSVADCKDRVDNATTLYFATLLIKYSHNPAINSEFNNLRKQLAEKGFAITTIEALQVNPEVLAETIKVMLKDNLDLSFFAKMLDSVRQMGVPVVDTVLKQYENITRNANDFVINKSDKLFDIFKKFYGSSIEDTLPSDISRTRHDEFRRKFIDDNTHQLITPFDRFNNDKIARTKKAEIYDKYMAKLKVLKAEADEFEAKRVEKIKELTDVVNKITDINKRIASSESDTEKETLKKERTNLNAESNRLADEANDYYNKVNAKLQDIDKAKTDRDIEIASVDNSLNKDIVFTGVPTKLEEVKGRQVIVIDFEKLDLDAMVNSTIAKQNDLTKAEILYLIKMLDQCLRSSLKDRANMINNISQVEHTDNYTTLKVVYNLPAERTVVNGILYNKLIRNSKFTSIANSSTDIASNKDLNFLLDLQDAIFDVTNEAILSVNRQSNFFPIFIKGSIKKELQSLLGYQSIEQDDYVNTVDGGVQYYLKAASMNKPRAFNVIGIKYGEMYEVDDYEATIEKARERAKSIGYKNPINSLQDIVKFNEVIYAEREDLLENKMNFDPINSLRQYVAQLGVVKTREDFRPTLQRLETLLASNSFEARNSNRNYTHRGIRKNTGKREIVTKKGKETDIFKRYKGFFDTFEGKGKINSTLDQVIRIFTTTNSRTLMWMNLTAAIKNIGTGNVNIWSEAVGGEFITAESILKAQTRYFAALIPLMSALGEHRITASDTDYTQAQLDAALIKLGGNIFEEGRELNKADVDVVTGILAKWDNVAYMPNSVGEHYLQFTTYLASMDTHRVVHGKIMNYEQFIYYLREKVLKDTLTADEYKAYENLKNDIIETKGNNSQFFDVIDEFLTNKKYNISKETKRKFADAYTEERKKAKKIFESTYPTVRSQFELKNGRAAIKSDSDLKITEFSGFLNKVRNVNNSLHGIYNSFDQSELSQRAYGEMMLQFRKWLRPSFIRFFGRRTGKIIFDEGLESYRSGAYLDAIKFVTHNAYKAWQRTLIAGREENRNEVLTYTKAFMNFIKGLIFFAQDMRLRYRTMPEFQRMNIRRAMGNAMSLALLTLAAGLIMAADWDDDDESEATEIMIALITSTVYGVQTELLETGITGMYLFYKRTSESPIPFETTLTSAIQVLYWGVAGYMFLDSDDLIVASGAHKGENKVWVNLKKIIPGARSFYRLIELPDNSNYYVKTNPILQILNKATKE